MQPDTFASVRTLATENRRSNSAICSELIEDALKLPKWKQQIEEAMIQVPSREDPRTAIRQPQLRKGKFDGYREAFQDWTPEEKRLLTEFQVEFAAEGVGSRLIPMAERVALLRLANAGTITMEQAKGGMVKPEEDTPDNTENEALRQQVKDQGAMLSKMQAMLEKLTGGGEG